MTLGGATVNGFVWTVTLLDIAAESKDLELCNIDQSIAEMSVNQTSRDSNSPNEN